MKHSFVRNRFVARRNLAFRDKARELSRMRAECSRMIFEYSHGAPSYPTEPVATRPLAIQKDSTWYTYGLDLPKNITEVYGTDGTIKTAYTYTPYGQVTVSGSVTQNLQWSSEYHDTDLALVYYNYRHYNPTDGRWTGRDIIGEVGAYNIMSYKYGGSDILGLLSTNSISATAEQAIMRGDVRALRDLLKLAKLAGNAALAKTIESELERVNRCNELRAKKEKFAKSGIEGATCKGLKPQKCPKESDCQVLADKIKKFKEAIKIRDEYDRECFGGGDSGHKEQLDGLGKGLERCSKYYKECISKLKRK